ncbi:trypsin-1-like isoform X1 [Scylla paramamosain]|uniref:trypsin-1-like isoform X1 n=1 Tax=Scylla paramamosain TaxID=85552 RepID=UPI003083C39F
MELKACCFLVFAALAWAPSRAREVGIYLQAMQGGIHVDPKQSCGEKMTVDGTGRTITSPDYPNNYPSNQRCSWIIKAQNPEATLEVECDDFDVTDCKDRMVIKENRKVMATFCGTGKQSYRSTGNRIAIKFRTNGSNTGKGFSCTVRIPESTVTSSTTDTCQCGVANPSRIVGGQEVDPKNKYPWQVGIMYNGGSNYWCGGSVINNKYILTAAHCVKGDDASSLVVGVADHDMYSTTDDVPGVTDLKSVEQIIIHSGYGSNGYDYDIALLKLKETLDLSQYEQLRPVCLPADDSQTYEGVMAIASGWGTLYSGGPQPSTLNEVSVPILAPSCPGMSGITANMLCAGLQEGGKDTCQGDSGGPLFVEENTKYTQVGITSWGFGCAGENSPGVYARVSKFLPWIMSNTADATYCQ